MLCDIGSDHLKRGGVLGMQRCPLLQGSWEFSTDDAAFFDWYGPVIFAYILKHVRSREDAEDLTLDVFTAAWEKGSLSQFRPEEQLAWLKRVTHHKLIDAYRKAQHRSSVNIDFFAEVLSDNDEPEQIVVQREVDHQLHQHIQRLPAFQQQLLYLRYAHNLSAAEIGVLLNKREGTIRQHLSRTRKRLRASYLRQEQKGGY
jgi:RNA polymerase sigma factor (sigma-70 family)